MNKSAFLVAIVLAGTAAASQAPSADSARRGPNNDPNEVVCVKEAQLGSRLAHRRVCRTRADWEEHHRQLRMAVEKAQFDKTTNSQ